MIFITVKWTVRPEYADSWLERVDEFTQGTRGEPGNIFFEWSRSVDDPNVYYVIEAFQDDAAEAHVSSDHFKTAIAWMPDIVAETPSIVSTQIEGMNGWGEMGEVKVRR
jgi:quinol monooxygenase YgiN